MSEQEARNLTTSTQRLEDLSADLRLRSVVAGNPAAPANLLERLAQDQDEKVREQVASNPNTPWKTLERLAAEFPQAFLHNPAGPLQMVAHPEQITIDKAFWAAILQEASIPAPCWSWLRNHPSLGASQAVHLHVQYVGETAFPCGVPMVGDESTLLTLVELLTTHARSVPIPADLLVSYEQIAGRHLQWLAHCADAQVRQAVAENEQTPAEVLSILAQDEDAGVQAFVASHARTPGEVLQALAQETSEIVRRKVAENPRTPVKVLSILAQDQNVRVRKAVAENEQTPGEVLQSLAQDHRQDITRTSAKSDAHANFARPSTDRIGHHAKDSGGCQQQRSHSKETKENQVESA